MTFSFGQTFAPADFGTIGMLVVMEGTLSVDNALVLGVLASRVPASKAGKALAFGLAGALIFRLFAVLLAAYLLQWSVAKFLGALYLIYLAIHHFVTPKSPAHRPPPADMTRGSFWRAVLGIELTDMVFAVDSILAAIAMVGPPPPGRVHPKLWVILVGGMLGVVLMRFSAAACVKMLRRFPHLETAAYLIVLVVAIKLLIEWQFGSRWDFQDWTTTPFWVFWAAMLGCLAVGLVPGSDKERGLRTKD
jgi:YkoY family integral membrane protein